MLWTLSWDASVIQYHFNLLLSNRCSRNFIAWNLFWRFWRTVYSKNLLSCLLSASFSLENCLFSYSCSALHSVPSLFLPRQMCPFYKPEVNSDIVHEYSLMLEDSINNPIFISKTHCYCVLVLIPLNYCRLNMHVVSFTWFQLPAVNHGPNIINGKFQK